MYIFLCCGDEYDDDDFLRKLAFPSFTAISELHFCKPSPITTGSGSGVL